MYNPLLEDFTVFDRVSDTGDMISRAVTRIESDEDSDIWISVDYQGLFHFDRVQDRLINCLHRDKRKNQLTNVTRFWFEEKLCWVSLYDDNLYYTKIILRHCFLSRILKEKSLLKMISLILGLWVPIIVGISVLLMV